MACVLHFRSIGRFCSVHRSLGRSESTWLYTVMDVWIIFERAKVDLNVPSLHDRRDCYNCDVQNAHQVMSTRSQGDSSSALCGLTSNSHQSVYAKGRIFIHSAVKLWNELPGSGIDEINDTDTQSFKSRVHHPVISTAADSSNLL